MHNSISRTKTTSRSRKKYFWGRNPEPRSGGNERETDPWTTRPGITKEETAKPGEKGPRNHGPRGSGGRRRIADMNAERPTTNCDEVNMDENRISIISLSNDFTSPSKQSVCLKEIFLNKVQSPLLTNSCLIVILLHNGYVYSCWICLFVSCRFILEYVLAMAVRLPNNAMSVSLYLTPWPLCCRLNVNRSCEIPLLIVCQDLHTYVCLRCCGDERW